MENQSCQDGNKMLTTGQIKSRIGNIMAALCKLVGRLFGWLAKKMRNEFMGPDGDDKSTKSDPILGTYHSGDHTRDPSTNTIPNPRPNPSRPT